MTIKELRTELLARLDESFAPLGYQRTDQTFARECGAYRLLFHLAFIQHGAADCDVTADVAVRHHQIESKLNAARTDLSAREAEQTATIGAELGNLNGTGQQRSTLRTASDVRPVIDDLMAWFDRVAQPFFRRFASPHEILRTLQIDDRYSKLLIPITEQRVRVRDALLELYGGAV